MMGGKALAASLRVRRRVATSPSCTLRPLASVLKPMVGAVWSSRSAMRWLLVLPARSLATTSMV